MLQITCPSPVGPLVVTEESGAITRLTWGEAPDQGVSPLLREAQAQLVSYFDGRLRQFDLPLRVRGSDFQRAVCAAMSSIPYGETMTYGEIAALTGNSAQAIGNACGANPIPILIPCHRVLGAGGRLVGFSGAGGIETKVQLLRLEGAAGLLI
ncbi:methylated-DNA-[protein]-cysteine S-methyltransferase [Aliiroseovarius crassostreae]|uniref:Methylated-DNA--protein-cysteine methyltransferase n=1 Tax=Aliiroseovarius crassostreae TaxID=154981 RepID=A0A0P7J7U6_9RHOB|nr:methylated-DNA--[protein]-cysteine S-methyltransferase [Aliiroseovarius crassostreae]KPN64591.1 cysteine methyltransferase [Aliiroseovarius crassostreae]SFU28635.1 methylated-DNA-[protein]-cysteine S-methyltransferase [Aliiroseovarius crassostreae]